MEYPFKDLLPLDEVLVREGYYKDWTHLDPEVFYSLTQISEYIKTKGYGVDVRLLIAQLAEHFGLKTTQVIDLANLLQQKFTNLEGVTQSFTNNINSLVAQMEADKDAVIANATVDSEVILARGGKATLGQRLDETTAQLEDIGYNRHPIIEKMLLKPNIVAHRALYKVFPENSIPAFYECAKRGIEFFETDFRKTSDGHWVCIHDATTGRTAGTNLVVANSTLGQLKKLRQINTANAALYGNPYIPTIDEVFQFIKKTNSIVNINFDYGILDGDIPTIVEKIYAYGIQNNVICQGPRWQAADGTLCISDQIALTDAAFDEARRKGNVIAAYNYGYSADVVAINKAVKLGSMYNVPILIYTVESYANFEKTDVTGVNSMMVDYPWFRTIGGKK